MPIGPPKRKVMTRSFASYFVAYMDNDLTTYAAAISYFSMLVLFPTLLLLLTVGNRVIGPEAVEKYVIGQVLALLPGAQNFVRKNLESITAISTELMVSCLLIMLWAASWLFTVIENALNRIYGTYPRSFLHGRLVNFAVMSLVFAFLGASAMVTAFVSGVRAAAATIPLNLGPAVTTLSGYLWQTLFIVASALITILLFAAIYKILPNTAVPLREALPGAVLAGVLWEGAKFGFAALLPYFHYDLVYGSIGAGVALLSWVYLSSVIMLFGAQFTALLHRDHLFEASVKSTNGSNDLTAAES